MIHKSVNVKLLIKGLELIKIMLFKQCVVTKINAIKMFFELLELSLLADLT